MSFLLNAGREAAEEPLTICVQPTLTRVLLLGWLPVQRSVPLSGWLPISGRVKAADAGR